MERQQEGQEKQPPNEEQKSVEIWTKSKVQWILDNNFFLETDKIENDINRSWIEEYLEKFSWKELSLVQLTVIFKQNPNRFWREKEFNEYLDLYNIKIPTSEIMAMVRKSFDVLKMKELTNTPKNIKTEDLIYFYENGDTSGFNTLLKNFVLSWEKWNINDFFNKLNSSNLPIKLDTLSVDTLNSILNSSLIETNNVWRFILGLSNSWLSVDAAIAIKAFIEKRWREFFNQDVVLSTVELLNNKIDKFSPKNIVEWFLKWIENDFNTAQLLLPWSPARNHWNTMFEENYDMRFNLIYKGKPEFFHAINLDIFFNLSFYSLTKEQKWSLHELIKTWWTYYEKIKWFRKYDEILEIAKKAQLS